ncbi:RNA polymerase sigma factor [Streptomyces sp. NBC_01237]|uniref:RNA polymerase sigma factor n=1 Tax=Streptomyces sp. NBC_01237 TaxID=2903790 RepID=UPI002DDC6B92|nr:sigma-70 family RNA polymerase sigma factor [Streptomyces sp. NBC_01237]WRZ78721.1 sigma-70 family RNA polymerase sigma factor [Streptomyces sp. NBC_01237]
MVIVAEQVRARVLRADLKEKAERWEREDTARGPEPEPEAGRQSSAARPADGPARELLGEWFALHAPMVLRVVGRAVRREDAHLVEDLAQDVWVEAWQYLLRGNEVARPVGLLAVMARSRVSAHYRSARVRRESATDFQVTELAVDRLVSWIGAVA